MVAIIPPSELKSTYARNLKPNLQSYRKKTHNRWSNDVLWDTMGENARFQAMINHGTLYQQDARTQLKVKSLIDAGVLKDRPFTLNGRES